MMSVAFVAGADYFARGFGPIEVRAECLSYIRISAFSALSSAVETAVVAAMRALDKPDVPLLISMSKCAINIILDMLIISRFHVGSHQPTINMQAGVQLACSMTAALVGLGYFLVNTSIKHWRHHCEEGVGMIPSPGALVLLLRPGFITLTESATCNTLYL